MNKEKISPRPPTPSLLRNESVMVNAGDGSKVGNDNLNLCTRYHELKNKPECEKDSTQSHKPGGHRVAGVRFSAFTNFPISKTTSYRLDQQLKLEGYTIVQWMAYLLPDPAAPGCILLRVRVNKAKSLIVDETHPVLA